jgi:hypothetical protein
MNANITSFKMSNKEIQSCIGLDSPEFPKYVTLFINRANRFSQATRPKNVGQLTELIKMFPGKTISEWDSWYCENYPDTIKIATKKIADMIRNFKDALNKITYEMIEDWVKDLVIVKTFIGLHFQEAILKKIAEVKGTTYRISNKQEEAKGVDGFIGSVPVSIKPDTYRQEKELKEGISNIIYYRKLDDGIEVDFSEV